MEHAVQLGGSREATSTEPPLGLRFAITFFFTAVFALEFFQFYRIVVLRTLITDFPIHLAWLPKLVSGEQFLPHPLFHVLTWGISAGLRLQLEEAATLLMAVVITLTALLQYRVILDAIAGERHAEWRALAGAGMLTVVCAIYVPFVNPNVYLGQFSPNVYHNPTFLMVKPFAIATVFLVLRILEGRARGRDYWWCGVAYALGLLAKPSFAMVFMPAVWLVVGFRVLVSGTRGPLVARRTVAFLGVLSALTLVVGSWQYVHTFTTASAGWLASNPTGESRLVFDTFLRHWRTRTPSVSYSIAAALAFPLAVTAFRWGSTFATPARSLPWVMLCLGMGMYTILIDTVWPGVSNVAWSYMIGQVMVFLYGVVEFVRWSPTPAETLRYRVTGVLLSLHVCSGVYFFALVATGRS